MHARVHPTIPPAHSRPPLAPTAPAAPPTQVYIIESGSCYISLPCGKPLATFEAGKVFGELALMYNAPRRANVWSCEKTRLWSLNRMNFRRIVAAGNSDPARRLTLPELKGHPWWLANATHVQAPV